MRMVLTFMYSALLSLGVVTAHAGDNASLVRAAHFEHVHMAAAERTGETLILLHGSGGNERSLVDLARKAAPGADLIGIRGRITQDGVSRWYKRITPTSFDQADIRLEAEALADHLAELSRRYGFDISTATFLGYSNGANLIAALSLLEPGLVRRAVLLRAMPVLDEVPQADLANADILSVAGETDVTYAPFAEKLDAILRQCGARVDNRIIPAGHLLGEQDAVLVGQWLASKTARLD